MKDLIELVATFDAGQRASKKWWVSIAATPFDAEPTGYTTGDDLATLMDDETFVASARAYLDASQEIPPFATKAYNRVARVMGLLARGDSRSHAIAKRFLARASDDAKFYVMDFEAASALER